MLGGEDRTSYHDRQWDNLALTLRVEVTLPLQLCRIVVGDADANGPAAEVDVHGIWISVAEHPTNTSGCRPCGFEES